jgi:transposase
VSPEVVVEATNGWYWAVDVLHAAGAEVHLAHPLGVKGFAYRRVKNDVRDAADLADLLRMGRLPEAWIAPPAVRELRELVRHRHKLVRLASSVKTQVHAVLAKNGIAVTVSDLFGVAGSKMLAQLRVAGGVPDPGRLAATRARCGRGRGRSVRPADPRTAEAVQHTPKNSPLRATYERIVERRGGQAKNIAKVAAARKLLTLVYYGLRDGEIRCLAEHAA